MYKNKLNALLMLVLLSGTLFVTSCGNDKDSTITVSKEEVASKIAELKKIEKTGGPEAVKKAINKELDELGGSEVLDHLDKMEAEIQRMEAEMQKNPTDDNLAIVKAGKDVLAELKALKTLFDSSASTEDLAEATVKIRKAKLIFDEKMKKAQEENKL